MKECRICKELKQSTEFFVHSLVTGKLRSECKLCTKAVQQKYQANNRSKINKKHRERYAGWGKPSQRASDRKWREKNRAHVNAKGREWRSKNMHVMNEHGRRRVAKQKQAFPVWANKFYIQEAYHLARLRSKITGIKWHVDHIVPLQSKLVCGLHVEHNLQVISASVNHRKSNRFWPDMP